MDFECWNSKTAKVMTGCGNLYITTDYNDDGSVHKIKLQRNSKFACPITIRDTLGKQATFQVRRDKKQLIKDLRGDEQNACDKFTATIKSAMKRDKLSAYSCSDAVARVLANET